MRITMFKTPKPRGFNYIPRYYDEQKEEFEKRKNRIEQEYKSQNGATEYVNTMHRGVMGNKLVARRKANNGTVIRLLVIIAILTVLVAYIFNLAWPTA